MFCDSSLSGDLSTEHEVSHDREGDQQQIRPFIEQIRPFIYSRSVHLLTADPSIYWMGGKDLGAEHEVGHDREGDQQQRQHHRWIEG